MTVRIRIDKALRELPELPTGLKIIPFKRLCLCPGCYFDKTPGSELCDRCTYDGCTDSESHHV